MTSNLDELIKVPTVGMSHEDWLRARKAGIGGSDAAGIVGLSPFEGATPTALYYDKTSDEITPSGTTEKMRWGTLLEPAVADEYARRHPGVTVKSYPYILRRPDAEYMIADLDRICIGANDELYGLEIKTTGSDNGWGNVRDEDDSTVPMHYILQVQHYMAVTGLPYFDVACLIRGQHYVQRRVARNNTIIAKLMEIEHDFWRCVETRTPPEWDTKAVMREMLQQAYPVVVKGKSVQLSEELRWIIDAYSKVEAEVDSLKAQLKPLEYELKSYKRQICEAMGDAEVATLGDITVTYKAQYRSPQAATVYRKFALKLPEPVEQEMRW